VARVNPVVWLAAAGFGLGILLVYDAFTRPRTVRQGPTRHVLDTLAVGSAAVLWALGAAAVGAAAAFFFTHWAALALIAGVLGFQAPGAISKGRAARQRLARQEALAQVAGRLRAAAQAGQGLPEAILRAAESPPTALREEMGLLKDLVQRRGAAEALDSLAEVSEDPMIRRFARTLAEAYRTGSTKLSLLLTAISEAAYLQSRTAREVRSRQTSIRLAANLMAVIPIVALLILRSRNPQFVTQYTTVQGQAVMLVGFGLVGAGWWIARSLGGQKSR
jgi:tight adherence protein B